MDVNLGTTDTPQVLAAIEAQQKRRAEQMRRSGEKVGKRRLLLAGEDWNAFWGEHEIEGEGKD